MCRQPLIHFPSLVIVELSSELVMEFTGNELSFILSCGNTVTSWIFCMNFRNLEFNFLYRSFREKVEIPATMSYITLKGVGADKTIIEWDDTADRKGTHGNVLGTYCSATFAVNSPYFVARNITFKVRSSLS